MFTLIHLLCDIFIFPLGRCCFICHECDPLIGYILFYSILFCSVLFYSILFYCTFGTTTTCLKPAFIDSSRPWAIFLAVYFNCLPPAVTCESLITSGATRRGLQHARFKTVVCVLKVSSMPEAKLKVVNYHVR